MIDRRASHEFGDASASSLPALAISSDLRANPTRSNLGLQVVGKDVRVRVGHHLREVTEAGSALEGVRVLIYPLSETGVSWGWRLWWSIEEALNRQWLGRD